MRSGRSRIDANFFSRRNLSVDVARDRGSRGVGAMPQTRPFPIKRCLGCFYSILQRLCFEIVLSMIRVDRMTFYRAIIHAFRGFATAVREKIWIPASKTKLSGETRN